MNEVKREGARQGRVPGCEVGGKMLNTHISERREVPLWAALGAPLIGVPLMVALLALTAPKQETPVDAPEAGATTELVEEQVVDHASCLPADYIQQTKRC
ncbi:MAG: hypothetical protein IIB36_06925 [Gemmatimonadetes bacterium]|nr:hypothetical protein [Gemmatimonadota bacterium]